MVGDSGRHARLVVAHRDRHLGYAPSAQARSAGTGLRYRQGKKGRFVAAHLQLACSRVHRVEVAGMRKSDKGNFHFKVSRLYKT